jgi:hypothetical protein
MICQQWAAVFSSISLMFSVTISEQYVPSWCRILLSNLYLCMTPTCYTDLLEDVVENFDVNFAMERDPSRRTVPNLVNKLRPTGLLRDKKLNISAECLLRKN